MPRDPFRALATVLGTGESALRSLDASMAARGIRRGVPERIFRENETRIAETLRPLGERPASASEVRSFLRTRVLADERRLLAFLDTLPGGTRFDRAARLAREIARVGAGYFLKRDRAERILRARPPKELIRFLGVGSIGDALARYDVTELMSALRFIESQAWMHETFDAVYRAFTADDFEERGIEVRVLGPVWRAVGEAFVAKKHHNVSHLKEFGVIFVNPIAEDVPGKFLRDFALLLHYFHEIAFYAKLFRRAAPEPDFAVRLTSLLRGDVPERRKVAPGEWLIVQRYLAKENPNDIRLRLPRVNPESLHWLRGERDLTQFVFPSGVPEITLWHDLDWVGGVFPDHPVEPERVPSVPPRAGGLPEVVSFDLEDTAMSLVSFMEGRNESFVYHQREAMWTRLFQEYVGGEEKMEELLIENFGRGVVQF